MLDNLGDELDFTIDDRRRCERNSSSISSCIDDDKRLCPWQRNRDSSQRAGKGQFEETEGF